MKIGINGLGRIGKSILLQSLKKDNIKIQAINIPNFNLGTLDSYLSNDSCHKTDLDRRDVYVINKNTVKIKNHVIKILDKREPEKDMWIDNDVEYLIETSGKFLTKEKAKKHNVPYFMMCAPSKDDTPQYLYNGNHDTYLNEKILSNSSCTTNSLVPLLKLLNDHFGIVSANFITVHAATASQHVIDGVHLKSRIHRSIINNIIPHTTGASESAIKILPELERKLFGTSVRIPTNNVSMIDLNVKLVKTLHIEEMLRWLRTRKEVEVNDDKHLVSSDFMTTTNPTIIDSNSCMMMGYGEYKFTIWYDNEWSYSAQALKLLEHIDNNKHLRW